MATPQTEIRTPIVGAAASAPADVFPLPVTPLEYYYLCDDQPAYPTTYLFELTFSGTLGREPLAEALRMALARHPLLTARIDWNNGGRPNWIAGAPPINIDWAPAEIPIGHADGERIDLAENSGLRVWVRESSGEARAYFQFHHAACDGLAACQFLEDVLIAYHAQFHEGFAERLRPLDPARLLTRDTFGVVDPNWRPTKRDIWRTVCHWARLLARPPRALSVPTPVPPAGQQQAFLEFVDHTFDVDETRWLRSAAPEGATLNDLLLRDLLLVLDRWNADHSGGGRLRVNVPTNLRSREDAAMPAANVISYAFVDRKLSRRSDPSELLQSIGHEMAAIKRDRPGLLFLGGLGFACGFRGFVPWMLRRHRSFATALLTNLGRLWARSPLPRREGKLIAGDAVLERVSASPPIRPLTRAAVAAIDYGQRMTIALRCDPASFSREQSQALLERFLAQVRQSIDEAPAGRIRKPR